MIIKVINKSNYKLPSYATEHSAGFDLKANIESPVLLKSLDRHLFGTGLYMEIPEGYEGQVRPRSGIAIKHGITCINTPGTIDADYRGEIGIELINLSDEDYVVQPGDRIAQMVIKKVEQVTFEEVETLSETNRGKGGFGSTGN